MRENNKKKKICILIVSFVLGILEIGCIAQENNEKEKVHGFIEDNTSFENIEQIENDIKQETNITEIESEDKQKYLKDELEKCLRNIKDENLIIKDEYKDEFPLKYIDHLEEMEINAVLDFLNIKEWNAPPFEEEDSMNEVDKFLGKYDENTLSLYTEQKKDITIDAYVGNYCPTRNVYDLDVCHVIKVYENGKITELGYNLYSYSSADYFFAPEIKSKYLCNSVKECKILGEISEDGIKECWFTEIGYDLIFEVNSEKFYIVCNQNDEIKEIYSLIEKESEVSHIDYEDTFLVNTDNLFNDYIQNNPIDKQYSISKSDTSEMISSYYENRNAWFKQCQYTLEKLETLTTNEEFSYIANAYDAWEKYYDNQLRFNREMFYIGKIAGDGITYLQTAAISDNLTKEMAIILLGFEYQLTGQVEFICEDIDGEGKTNLFLYENTCIASEMDFYDILNEDSYVNNKSDKEWLEMIESFRSELIENCANASIEMLDEEISAWIECSQKLHKAELLIYNDKKDVVDQVYLTRMKQLAIRLSAMQYQIEL